MGLLFLLLLLIVIVVIVILACVVFVLTKKKKKKNNSESDSSSIRLEEGTVSQEMRDFSSASLNTTSSSMVPMAAGAAGGATQSAVPIVLHSVQDMVQKNPLSREERALSDKALASISSGTPIPSSLFATATWASWVKIAAHMISDSAANGCELILAIWGSMESMNARLELLRTTPMLQLLQSALHATSKEEQAAWTVISRVQGDFYPHITDPNDRPRTIEDLGNGAFGWVRKAEWTRNGGSTEIVAVKQITYKKKFLGDASNTTYTTSFAKIQREVLLMSILSMASSSEASRLIAFRGHYLEHYSVCIMMQCALGSLKEYLEERRFRRRQRTKSENTPKQQQQQGEEALKLKVDVEDLVLKINIASQVASGLLFLHSVGIVHRDLKNENVLIVARPENGIPSVTLTDFGLSRAASASSTMVGGTISWASPELLDADVIHEEGSEHKTIIAASSDVYSFGYLLWSLLLEREPHGRYLLSKKKIKEMVLANPDCPLEIPDLEPDPTTPATATRVAERYSRLILECWRMKPEDRPTMSSVLEELKALNSQIEPSSSSK